MRNPSARPVRIATFRRAHLADLSLPEDKEEAERTFAEGTPASRVWIRKLAGGRAGPVRAEWTVCPIGQDRCLVEEGVKVETEGVGKIARDFIYTATHELLEPARTVTGFAALLAEENSAEDTRRFLDRVRSGAERLTAQITAPKVAVTARRLGDRVQISVSDNGSGIIETQREEALKLLRQLQRRGGVGLGAG